MMAQLQYILPSVLLDRQCGCLAHKRILFSNLMRSSLADQLLLITSMLLIFLSLLLNNHSLVRWLPPCLVMNMSLMMWRCHMTRHQALRLTRLDWLVVADLCQCGATHQTSSRGQDQADTVYHTGALEQLEHPHCGCHTPYYTLYQHPILYHTSNHLYHTTLPTRKIIPH